jgi:hypothetical protein
MNERRLEAFGCDKEAKGGTCCGEWCGDGTKCVSTQFPRKQDAEFLKLLQDKVVYAQDRLKTYEAACLNCRVFDNPLLIETGGGFAMYSIPEVEQKGDGYYCKVCGRCVYSGEH